jgi:hypothetical protein
MGICSAPRGRCRFARPNASEWFERLDAQSLLRLPEPRSRSKPFGFVIYVQKCFSTHVNTVNPSTSGQSAQSDRPRSYAACKARGRRLASQWLG